MTSVVTPIYKSGNSTEIVNYRPIGIVPVVSKVVQKVIFSTNAINLLDSYLNQWKQHTRIGSRVSTFAECPIGVGPTGINPGTTSVQLIHQAYTSMIFPLYAFVRGNCKAQFRSTTLGQTAFSVRAIQLWNTIPISISLPSWVLKLKWLKARQLCNH